MQISQIYLTDNNAPPPEFISNCMNAVRASFSHVPYTLYNMESAREFITQHFDNEVLNAYDTLNPYAYKADLLKYCLLYAIGGWYFDIAVRLISTIDVHDEIETIAFKDMPIISQTTWSCANAILYSKPSSSVYSAAIELVLQNCRNKYYGTNALCPTGPVLLGKAFAKEGENSHRIFGDFICLTPVHQNKNPAFVLPDGLIFALGKPTGGGDLKGLGALGTNNYNDFYNSRSVYKSCFSI